jgi:hypothetical protein
MELPHAGDKNFQLRSDFHSIINRPSKPAWLKDLAVIDMGLYRRFYRQKRRSFTGAGDGAICGESTVSTLLSITVNFTPSPTLRLTIAIIGLRAHGTNRLASGLAMEVSCEIVGHLCSLRALAEPALFIKIDGRHHMDELVPSLEKYAAFARAGYAMAHRYSTG